MSNIGHQEFSPIECLSIILGNIKNVCADHDVEVQLWTDELMEKNLYSGWCILVYF